MSSTSSTSYEDLGSFHQISPSDILQPVINVLKPGSDEATEQYLTHHVQPNPSDADLIMENSYAIQQVLEAVEALKPELAATIVKAEVDPASLQRITEHIDEVLASDNTKSIIANAIAGGAGNLVGTAIVKAIFESIKLPFSAGSEAAAGIRDLAGAVNESAQASRNIIDAFRDAKKEVNDAIGGVSEAVSRLTSQESNSEKILDRSIKDQADRLAQTVTDAVTLALSDASRQLQASREEAAAGLSRVADSLAVAADNAQRHRELSNVRQAATDRSLGQLGDSVTSLRGMGPFQDATIPSALASAGKSIVKKRAAPITPGTVEFGDHSVTLASVMEKILYDTETEEKANIANFWREVISHTGVWKDSYSTDRDGICRLASTNQWFGEAGETAHTHRFECQVQQYVSNLTEANAFTPPKVNFRSSVIMSEVTDDKLAQLRTAGLINDRTVVNTMNGFLAPGNIQALRDLAPKLAEHIIYYDNVALYAKLLHYALIQNLSSESGAALAPRPWAADITVVNLDDAQLDVAPLSTAIDNGSIVVVEKFDWHRTNNLSYNLLQLISSGGYLLTNADAAQRGPVSRYYEWPQIKVTLLAHGPVPAWPPAAVCPAAEVIDFCHRLAINRSEEDQMLRGLYAAMELCGTQLRYLDDDALSRKCISLFFGSADFSLPAPRDYSYMARFLNIKPAFPGNEVNTEVVAFISTPVPERARLINMYTGWINALSSSYLAGVNLTTQDIVYWHSHVRGNAPQQRDITFDSIVYPMAEPNMHYQECDATFHYVVRANFATMFDITIPTQTWVQQLWLAQPGSITVAVAQRMYEGLDDNYAPRYGTMLAFTLFFKKYPKEWGISDKGASCNIESEVILFGNPNQQGWFATRGDREYAQAAVGDTPYHLMMYGWQVLQVLANKAWLGQAPDLGLSLHPWAPGQEPQLWERDAHPDAHQLPLWNVDGHCFEPLTFKSYDYTTNTLFAPYLPRDDGWWERYMYDDGKRPNAGLWNPLKAAPVQPPPMRGLVRAVPRAVLKKQGKLPPPEAHPNA